MNFIPVDLVESFLEFAGKRIFTVTVEKKDGSIRRFNCRRGVKKGLKGGENKLPEFYYTVYDFSVGSYRCFNINKVIKIKCRGIILEAA